MAFEIASEAFSQGKTIPTQYTCDGPDVSPPLRWSDAPKGAREFALICDDPDAPRGVWVHWVLWGISSDTHSLPEGLGKKAPLSPGMKEGVTDFGRPGYGGPCPPPGKPHRYFFKLYALDAPVTVAGKGSKEQLLEAMEGHILGTAELMGAYGR